jgi:hypothetical protein
MSIKKILEVAARFEKSAQSELAPDTMDIRNVLMRQLGLTQDQVEVDTHYKSLSLTEGPSQQYFIVRIPYDFKDRVEAVKAFLEQKYPGWEFWVSHSMG